MHVSTHLDIDLVAIDQADEVTCLLEFTAPESPATQQRPGRTLMLVLDRSGSMAGEPLAAAKDAIARLVRQLAPHDCFGLVVFDDQAEVVIPPMLMADHAMESLQRAIAGIRTGGSTDLSAGYVLALREVKRSLAQTKHTGATVLLVSDGHANSGVTEPDRLKAVAAKARLTVRQGGLLATGDSVAAALPRNWLAVEQRVAGCRENEALLCTARALPLGARRPQASMPMIISCRSCLPGRTSRLTATCVHVE
jgi:uncharacterized protein (DUF58 family)